MRNRSRPTSTPATCLTPTSSSGPRASSASPTSCSGQIAYAEIFVTDRLWPDFRGIHLLEAIQNYQQRERRFGGLGEGTDENLEGKEPALEPADQVAAEIEDQLLPRQLTRR